jgi:hypothetical protein
MAQRYIRRFREGDYLNDPREGNIKISNFEVITFNNVNRMRVAQDEQRRTLRNI